MPKKGKKPGEFTKTKAAHKRRQAVYDALKKMREEGSTKAHWRGQEYIFRDPMRGLCHGDEVLAKIGNDIHRCLFSEKDGWRLASLDRDVTMHTQGQNILAILETP